MANMKLSEEQIKQIILSVDDSTELRHWHNGKYGQQGANGIVNPAVWTISD